MKIIKRIPKDWCCLECGHRMTLAQATRASRNVQGCPKCGSADIDLREEVTQVIPVQTMSDLVNSTTEEI